MLRQTIECRNFQLDCVLSARVFWQVPNKENRQREISQTVYKQTLRCTSLNSYNYFLCIGVYASNVWSKVGRYKLYSTVGVSPSTQHCLYMQEQHNNSIHTAMPNARFKQCSHSLYMHMDSLAIQRRFTVARSQM